MEEKRPVIGDLNTCPRKGEKLGLKAGTHLWADDNFEPAFARK